MYISLAIIISIAVISYLILHLPVFGDHPRGNRLKRLKALPNYIDGSVQNLSPTLMKPEGVSYVDMIAAFMKKNPNRIPQFSLPSAIPNFDQTQDPKITWFGHSSYLLQINNCNILVDPVFSASTSPFSFIGNKNFEGTDINAVESLPDLDVILITHDHYDHMDYQTILKLKARTKLFVTSLGVGAHLERWNIPAEKIIELSWDEQYVVGDLKLTATPARHFTGRGIKRNQTMWSSFVLEAGGHKIFIGGDSGYDDHFSTIGNVHGPFDLAILECGQYDAFWPYIHMFPEQTVQATIDLQAKVLMPVHWGKFSLAMHPWNEPVMRVTAEASVKGLALATPMVGESFTLGSTLPTEKWWLQLRAS